jgi:hypothetical protein
MITGITVPANNRLQRKVIDKVPTYERQGAAAELGRYAAAEAYLSVHLHRVRPTTMAPARV